MSIRIALLGLGKIARDQHVPVLRAHPGFELTAVVSRNATLEGVPAFATLDAMLASAIPVDAISLCQPPQVRFDAAQRAIAAGLHVFLEKPPGATLSEVEVLTAAARARGVSLFASWHSRYAPAVQAARAWLADRELRSVQIEWKEDVRVWHPGQEWIWDAGGFGVFDPGINALSIATAILPRPFFLQSGILSFPENREAPVAADLTFRDTHGVPIKAEFDFLQTGPQTWNIQVETTSGRMLLARGGSELLLDGVRQASAPEAEYRSLYERFATLIASAESDVDVAPLRHVADAFLLCSRKRAARFMY